MVTAFDRRMMAAAIRLSRRHAGRTGSNPSVATLIVRDDDPGGPVIAGRGITAVGGRPHAEASALAEAGERARGATAYVTLEPCAHHGRTPPCAHALVTAGIRRVVAAASDPDERVSGKGYAILREAGIAVETGVLEEDAASAMAGYLMQRIRKRPHVTVKMAVSSDGMIGRTGQGQVAVTGAISRAQVHVLRAQSDAIMVGAGTAIADDPALTCRLPGLEDRSPVRIVADRRLRTPMASALVSSARDVPVWFATTAVPDDPARRSLEEAGARFVASVATDDGIALPELLEDLAARGIFSLMVEGGASLVGAFVEDDLVDRIALYTGPATIGPQGVPAPFSRHAVPGGFALARRAVYGDDRYDEYERQR